MKSIQPFITLGWHTVPLRGSLKRLDDGSKTIPDYPKGWRVKYTENKNSKATEIGGAITGQCSGIIAIDCDNTATYELFKAIDPDYEFVFVSKGKGKEAGTIIYEYTDELPDNFSIQNDVLALDFYSNNGFVYLPTEANETKVPFGKMPKLSPMPEHVKALITQLLMSKSVPKEAREHSANNLKAQCLEPLVQQFTNKRKFMPGLFRILTPKSFRDLPTYVNDGYLHPKDIPSGRGSEYLSKLSAILGADISINEELYVQAMHDINELFSEPMDDNRFDKTILEPMLNGGAAVDGEPIWQYDENWADYRLVLQTKRQASLELCYDDMRQLYYTIDLANERFQKFTSDNDLMSHVKAISISAPTKPEVLTSLPLINVMSDASRDFGFHSDDDPTARTFNTFIRTPELNIINNPEPYKNYYKEPTALLKYLEQLVPNEQTHSYLLRFIKRKLTRFEYSPVILFFMGAHGSGKDLFVEIIETIMGVVTRPTVKEFLEIYNGYMLDTYFCQLDEFGNQLTNARDKDEALGKLKAYTGKSKITVRKMRTDGFDYKHNVTFISTANKNPFMLEDGDRRVCFMATPNKFQTYDLGVPLDDAYDIIKSQIKDFCYYLATEVTELPKSEYVTAPDAPEKHRMVADSMYAAARICYAFKHKMLDYLKEAAQDLGAHTFAEQLNNSRVYVDGMEDLYDAMTEFQGDMRALNKHMRANNFALIPTTKNGGKTYYYDLDLGADHMFTPEPVGGGYE